MAHNVMRAFTLLESVLYMAIFSLLLSGFLSGFFALSESAGKNQTRALLETEGSFYMAKIVYEIQHSVGITEPGEATSNELSLITHSGDTVRIQLDSGALYRTENGIPSQLSGNGIVVSNLDFSFIPSDSSSSTYAAISEYQVSFEISATSSSGRPISQSFSEDTFPFYE
jgi:type II secretory pathway pseudopilin PulG